MARTTIGCAVNVAGSAAAVPGRVIGLVEEAERLVGRVGEIVERADGLVERATTAVNEAEGIIRHSRDVVTAAEQVVSTAENVSAAAGTVVSDAESVSARAAETVERAERATGTVDGLLATYEPTVQRAAPMLERFVDELSPKEVDAAIRLVDELPVLTEHVLSDILPILRTLDRVGPEIHELLEVSHDVRRAIVGIPGFRFFRRRGQQRVAGAEALDAEGRHLPAEEEAAQPPAESPDERYPGTHGTAYGGGAGHGSAPGGPAEH